MSGRRVDDVARDNKSYNFFCRSCPQAYYNRGGGCFTGDTLVALADGTTKRADALCAGDTVRPQRAFGYVANCFVSLDIF